MEMWYNKIHGDKVTILGAGNSLYFIFKGDQPRVVEINNAQVARLKKYWQDGQQNIAIEIRLICDEKNYAVMSDIPEKYKALINAANL